MLKRLVIILVFTLGFVFSLTTAVFAAELQFEVVSSEISLQIGNVSADAAVLDAGSIKEGTTSFSPFSFQVTNSSEWNQSVNISAAVGNAVNGEVTLQPVTGTSDPGSGYFALLYGTGDTQPQAFSGANSLGSNAAGIITGLAWDASARVWLKLLIPADTAIGNYAAPLTLTAQFN